jgi:hypothetical protein
LFWGRSIGERGKGARGIYLDEVVEDGLKVLIGAVMERVDHLAALEADQYHVVSHGGVCFVVLNYDFGVQKFSARPTGNFHFVSHKALIPS